MIEIWKNIKGYEKLYQVSNLGNVKSLKRKIITYNGKKMCLKTVQERILKSSLTKNGYLKVGLTKNGKTKTYLVHLLVIRTFKGISKLYTDHKDCNKINNNINNLEYVTPKENTIRAIKNNLIHKRENKINQYDLNGNFIKTWLNCKDIEKELNLDHSNIIKCCKGKRNKCGNYYWEYYLEQ